MIINGFCKMIVIVIFFIALHTIFPVVGAAEESMLPEAPVYVDGQPINTKYMLKDGHFMVPALFLKHTGARVDWNEEYNSVTFRLDDKYFAVPIGTRYTDTLLPGTEKWVRDTLSTSTVEVHQDIFVPLNDIAKKLGMEVVYRQQTRKTYINTQRELGKGPIRSGRSNADRKLVALTFDDGPENHYTSQILDILKEKRVPATFFVMGKQVRQYPTMMKRMVEEGHGIGNHTFNHPSLPQLSTSEVMREVETTQQTLQWITGRQPDLFRPPYGAITRADQEVLNEMGFRTIMWTVDTLDWTGISGQEILDIVRRDITPGGIILQHNIEVNPDLLRGTVEALPMIIDELRDRGYQFVTVQTMLEAQ
ncbi:MULTISPECIES: polysaccharide deacetylase family protein [Bacillaceae]|uniref:Polysaccharide deacetylase family protein n=1 Tax=Evansella alkalicola TaxID=745819 RepID=A0ABS6JXY5_9BACI|nr:MULTISPECIES: polysaccharide deacetylase family protein [Bacillaceae]MBU9723348.1 polysaccharide deacetylase family protein [Bacillus alkalicola]